MRFIGLDVHRDFCEVAIAEDGELRSVGRVETSPQALELFAASLGSEDEVALEATGVAASIARIIGPHVARVLVAKGQDCRVATEKPRPTASTPARSPGC